MCLAAPSRIIELRDGMAVVECFGMVREVSLLLMDEDLAVGDYLLIQAGGFAFEKVEIERALEALDADARGDGAGRRCARLGFVFGRMNFRFESENPADAVEEAFFRIQREQMADVPILNSALSVEAVDFQRWQGHWLGVVVTPWCMSLCCCPAAIRAGSPPATTSAASCTFRPAISPSSAAARPELGEYQSCPLFSPMNRFATQHEASLTARASLVALLTVPGQAEAAATVSRGEKPSLSRRRFLAMP
jgi:hydrogenase assembly chaperone HypC/HupF